jgi:hypothetical protein
MVASDWSLGIGDWPGRLAAQTYAVGCKMTRDEKSKRKFRQVIPQQGERHVFATKDDFN